MISTQFKRKLSSSTTTKVSPFFAALSPADQAKYSAFSQRTKLPLSQHDSFLSALTHPSFTLKQDTNFQRLQLLGESALLLYSTEHCYCKYPKLPSDGLESLVKSFTGMSSLSDIGESVGIKNVMRWTPLVDSTGKTGERAICARVFQALIGAIYTATVRLFMNILKLINNYRDQSLRVILLVRMYYQDKFKSINI